MKKDLFKSAGLFALMSALLFILSVIIPGCFAVLDAEAQTVPNRANVTTTTNGVLTGSSTNFFSTNLTALLNAIGSNYATPAQVVAATNGLASGAFTSAAALRDRSTHTGTQLLSTISDAGTMARESTNDWLRGVAAGTGVTTSTNNGVVTVNASGGGGNAAYAQAITVSDTTNRSTSSATFTNSFVQATLTNNLASTSSAVEIQVSGYAGGSTTAGILFTIFAWDGATETDIKPAAVNALGGVLITSSAGLEPFSFTFVHTNITSTTPLTYRLAWNVNSGTAVMGRRSSDTFYDLPTNITLREKVR